MIEDDIQLELFLNTINSSGYENDEQYNNDIKRLFKILDRTVARNQKASDYLRGIIQRIQDNEIILESNKENKFRLNDEAAKN